jgi:hypothetical protein
MNINDYPTPETDKAWQGCSPMDFKGLEILTKMRDLERRLALCRDALKVFAEYHTGDLSNVGGATLISPQFSAQAFKDAKKALTATAPK